MKRPPGITPPPPAPPPPPSSSPRKPAAKKPTPTAPRVPASPRDAATAPVERLKPASTKGAWWKNGPDPSSVPRTGSSPAAATEPIAGISRGSSAAGQATRKPDENLYSPDARKRLRKAARARRRYERAEARRFTQRSRRRRVAWLVAAAAVAGLVLVVLLAAYSPLLAVRTIALEGTSRQDPAAVTAALDDQLGKPLALVDYGSIERDLAAFPLIESYSVEARPPDTLAVRVVERRPVAQVQTATGFDLIDAAGVTVQQATERIPGFPVLDLTGTAIGSPGFEAAAAVLTSLPDTLLSQVDGITGSTPDSVTFRFVGAGQSVVWGSPEDGELKVRILERLIPTQDPASPVQYDVSSPASPVVR